MTQHTWYLMRHLLARESLFVGDQIKIPHTPRTTIVGNGIHPDHEPHLVAGQYELAEKIGETLAVPFGGRVLIAPSPLARAQETARHMFVGMARAYAKKAIGEDLSTNDAKGWLEKNGLHKRARYSVMEELAEPSYKNSYGNRDEGNELVALAYDEASNPNFPGYRYMVQKGFEHDFRSVPPDVIATSALSELLLDLIEHDVVLSASHQPNLEVITAALTKGLGKDANELWANAGGGYAMGGGFRLTAYYEPICRIFTVAELYRSGADKGTALETPLEVNLDTLNRCFRYQSLL